jgi:hypothetical protein
MAGGRFVQRHSCIFSYNGATTAINDHTAMEDALVPLAIFTMSASAAVPGEFQITVKFKGF